MPGTVRTKNSFIFRRKTGMPNDSARQNALSAVLSEKSGGRRPDRFGRARHAEHRRSERKSSRIGRTVFPEKGIQSGQTVHGNIRAGISRRRIRGDGEILQSFIPESRGNICQITAVFSEISFRSFLPVPFPKRVFPPADEQIAFFLPVRRRQIRSFRNK